MEIKCLKCEKAYEPNQANMKIYGPYIDTECPFCHCRWEGKLLNFVDAQIGGHKSLSASSAREMQALAQYIELNASDYYKKKGLRHGKKKVRDIRD